MTRDLKQLPPGTIDDPPHRRYIWRVNSEEADVRRSVGAYSRYAARYDRIHPEIFNPVEQRRLRDVVMRAASEIKSGGRTALDYGCGSGNLTRHMTELGFDVVAADVSPHFLTRIGSTHAVDTLLLTQGAGSVADDSFDLIGLYSVLHHVRDYVATAVDLVSKLRVGGVLLIDHEHNDSYWHPDESLAEFREEMRAVLSARPKRAWDPDRRRWQYLLRAACSPRRNYHRFRRWQNPRWSREGDIHVWPDDHIEFDRLKRALRAAGASTVFENDYLLYTADYDEATWRRYAGTATDMTTLLLRREQ